MWPLAGVNIWTVDCPWPHRQGSGRSHRDGPTSQMGRLKPRGLSTALHSDSPHCAQTGDNLSLNDTEAHGLGLRITAALLVQPQGQINERWSRKSRQRSGGGRGHKRHLKCRATPWVRRGPHFHLISALTLMWALVPAPQSRRPRHCALATMPAHALHTTSLAGG